MIKSMTGFASVTDEEERGTVGRRLDVLLPRPTLLVEEERRARIGTAPTDELADRLVVVRHSSVVACRTTGERIHLEISSS